MILQRSILPPLALSLPLFALSSLAAAHLDSAAASEIMRESVNVTTGNWKAAPSYSFIRTDVKSKHDAEPVRRTYAILMIEGSPYNKVVAEDGAPLSPAREAEEDRKVAQEIAKRQQESKRERQKRLNRYNEERTRDHTLLTELTDAFDYTITGEERLAGRDVWVLHGTPKPGYQPKSTEAKVLSNMDVRFWVDKPTHQWVKVEAEVIKPVSLYGSLAKVGSGTRFLLEQEPVQDHLWLPKHFNMRVKAAALGFLNENSVQDEVYTEYRPMGQAVSELKRANAVR